MDSKNAIKIAENIPRFWDDSLLTFSHNFSHLGREYMWSAVNMLPNNPNISDLTKVDISQLKFS